MAGWRGELYGEESLFEEGVVGVGDCEGSRGWRGHCGGLSNMA